MTTHNPIHTTPIDVHAALARAHANRAEYIRLGFAGVPALFKRLASKLRPHRLPRTGACA